MYKSLCSYINYICILIIFQQKFLEKSSRLTEPIPFSATVIKKYIINILVTKIVSLKYENYNRLRLYTIDGIPFISVIITNRATPSEHMIDMLCGKTMTNSRRYKFLKGKTHPYSYLTGELAGRQFRN